MLSQQENELLTHTGPGTPMGDLFRRFWLPAMLSTELPDPDCPPVKLTLLSEDLVAFRDSSGKVGILDRYCPHRGSSLYWGHNEEEGLRCVYHGWKFDVNGTCVDMPNEPTESRFKDKIKTLAYPTEERGGVIWIYMGPRDLNPQMPELEWTRVPESHRYASKRIQNCNYLQNVEGECDSAHVSFLHGVARRLDPASSQFLSRYEAQDQHPRFSVKRSDHGLLIGARRDAGEEGFYWRITPFLMPSYTIIPSAPEAPLYLTFTGAVPIDDTHMIGWTVTWRPERPLTANEIEWCSSGVGSHVSTLPGSFSMAANKANDYLIDRELQRNETFTGIRGVREQDVAVQEDQWGPVTRRWKEHLGTTDLAVIALRRHLLKEAMDLQKGIEPPEAHNGAAYSVRSAALVLGRETVWDEGARPEMTPTT
jgi:phthalate 4,5-dioxygenase